MALTLETSESTELDSQFLNAPGTYHVAVIGTDEQPEKKDNSGFIDAFEVQIEVLAGPHAKKTSRLLFNNPNSNHKDKGEFARKMQTRILEILGLIGEEQKGKAVSVELSHAMGRQFIARFKAEEYNGKQQIRLDGGNFWHIDDPNADQCERNESAIGLLSKSLRRDPASFKKASPTPAAGHANAGGKNGGGNGGAKKPPVNLDDL